jgi:hypothetical protein
MTREAGIVLWKTLAQDSNGVGVTADIGTRRQPFAFWDLGYASIP